MSNFDEFEIEDMVIDILQWYKKPLIPIGVKLLHEKAELPRRLNGNGYDLVSPHEVLIHSGEQKKIGLGIAIAIPKGYCGQIWDRSGLGSQGKKVFAGVVDDCFRGELCVCLRNFSPKTWEIMPGDRVAQLLIVETPPFEFVVVDELPKTDRNENAFGSSGR